jgi:hypothetical protein
MVSATTAISGRFKSTAGVLHLSWMEFWLEQILPILFLMDARVYHAPQTQPPLGTQIAGCSPDCEKFSHIAERVIFQRMFLQRPSVAKFLEDFTVLYTSGLSPAGRKSLRGAAPKA